MKHKIAIPDSQNYLFTGESDKEFAGELLNHVILETKPVTTPALWQDVEIFVRYKKRDVYSLSDEKYVNAQKAVVKFRIKYILEHLKKNEILKIYKDFFSQEVGGEDNKTLECFFYEKLGVVIDDMFLVQEKNIIKKEDLKNFEEIFQYPSYVELDKGAIRECFDRVMKDKFSDTEIQYFFGASDNMAEYDKWYEAAKHVLMTTQDPQTFWTAGDILNIVWKAVPDDEKLQKWFRDQVYEIFWPRVGSTWPMINKDAIDWQASDEMRIAADAMGWLGSLKDLRERLPELPEDYELNLSEDENEVFDNKVGEVLAQNDGDRAAYAGIRANFYELCDMACTDKHLEDLEYVKKELVKEYEVWSDQSEGFSRELDAAIKHAKKYVADRKREGEILKKYIKERM